MIPRRKPAASCDTRSVATTTQKHAADTRIADTKKLDVDNPGDKLRYSQNYVENALRNSLLQTSRGFLGKSFRAMLLGSKKEKLQNSLGRIKNLHFFAHSLLNPGRSLRGDLRDEDCAE